MNITCTSRNHIFLGNHQEMSRAITLNRTHAHGRHPECTAACSSNCTYPVCQIEAREPHCDTQKGPSSYGMRTGLLEDGA